jgi:3-methyladenine DNA glycosylase Mpg
MSYDGFMSLIVHMCRKSNGKICAALEIDRTLSGHNLAEPPVMLIKRPELSDAEITVGKRIGISKAVHELRRFYVTNSPYVSKK